MRCPKCKGYMENTFSTIFECVDCGHRVDIFALSCVGELN